MNKYLLKIAEAHGEPQGQPLEKVALRKIVEQIAKGNVKKHLLDLAEQGFIKSPKVYAEGMKRGNAVLSKQFQAPISRSAAGRDNHMTSTLNASGGAALLTHKTGPKIHHAVGKKSPLSINFLPDTPYSKQLNNINASAAIRHELHEANEARHLVGQGKWKRVSKQESIAGLKKRLSSIGVHEVPHLDKHVPRIESNSLKLDAPPIVDRDLGVIGNHLSTRVLGRESEDVRKNPYLRISPMARLRGYGEADLIHKLTGKRYGQDKMTGKDLKKLHNAPVSVDQAGNKYIDATPDE